MNIAAKYRSCLLLDIIHVQQLVAKQWLVLNNHQQDIIMPHGKRTHRRYMCLREEEELFDIIEYYY